MKKTLLLIAIVSLVGLTSCKKERTCTCINTSTDNTGVVTTSEPTVTTYKKVSKSQAKDKCLSFKEDYSSTYGGTTNTSKYENKCELK